MNRLFSILFLIFLLTCVFASQVLAGMPAARVDDTTSAGCKILTGSTNVFINGLGAARKTDPLTCAGTITQGSNTVVINGLPAAREGDTVIQTIYVPWPELLPGTIILGSPNVEIGG
jgi:uncharacterized Zn-binding protein involved in type VI secretion